MLWFLWFVDQFVESNKWILDPIRSVCVWAVCLDVLIHQWLREMSVCEYQLIELCTPWIGNSPGVFISCNLILGSEMLFLVYGSGNTYSWMEFFEYGYIWKHVKAPFCIDKLYFNSLVTHCISISSFLFPICRSLERTCTFCIYNYAVGCSWILWNLLLCIIYLNNNSGIYLHGMD